MRLTEEQKKTLYEELIAHFGGDAFSTGFRMAVTIVDYVDHERVEPVLKKILDEDRLETFLRICRNVLGTRATTPDIHTPIAHS